MNTTSPRNETHARIERSLLSLPPADHYSLLGVSFSLQTDNSEVRDFFRAAYRHFKHPAGFDKEPLRLLAILSPETGGPLAAAGDTMIDLAGRPMPVNRAFLFLLNALMDQISEYVLIHGAAASIGGKGIILAGPPTAGKSTLVLELARRGAAFLSDDVAPVHRGTGLLHPFPRAIGIRRDGEDAARLDRSVLSPAYIHELPHKWLVDAAGLGLRLPGPADAPCPVAAVLLLDSGEAERPGARGHGRRRMEIAAAEEDAGFLAELRATPGVFDVRPLEGRGFPVFTFEVERASSPMRALAEINRRRRDLILYMDEARHPRPGHEDTPEIREARWSVVLIELARELLNRSETGLLMASCGALPGLLSEMGGLLRSARAFRLRPGRPDRTAELILELARADR